MSSEIFRPARLYLSTAMEDMGRPVYPYELTDPDLSWLISSFLENNPNYCLVENACLPVVFLRTDNVSQLGDYEQSAEETKDRVRE